MKTEDEIKHLCEQLKADKHYYYSWQANIAMQFKDSCARHGVNFPELHDIANEAAINFLFLLCREPQGKKDE